MAQKLPLLKDLRYRIEALLVFILTGIFNVMPYGVSSRLCAKLASLIGPKTRGQEVIIKNLKIVYGDELNEQARLVMSDKIWRHLGGVAVDLCRLNKIKSRWGDYIHIDDLSIIEQIKDNQQPSLFLSAHFGSWEIASMTMPLLGLDLDYIYRAPNNPFLKNWLVKRRLYSERLTLHAKGSDGAKAMVKRFREKGHFGLLFDQKLSKGEPISFFGKECATATTPFELAIRNGYQIVMVHCVRQQNGFSDPEFKIKFKTLNENININGTVKEKAAYVALDAHKELERWILETPEQWFWPHDRWGK